MRNTIKLIAATAFVFSAFSATSTVSANAFVAADDHAKKELSAGDWSAAEAALLKDDATGEDGVFTKLNLAFVYSTTGRKDMAAALYKEILASKENPYALTLSGQPRRVKTIAKVALAKLDDQN